MKEPHGFSYWIWDIDPLGGCPEIDPASPSLDLNIAAIVVKVTVLRDTGGTQSAQTHTVPGGLAHR